MIDDFSEKMRDVEVKIQRWKGRFTSYFVDVWRLNRSIVDDDISQAVPKQIERTVLFNKKQKQLCIEQF